VKDARRCNIVHLDIVTDFIRRAGSPPPGDPGRAHRDGTAVWLLQLALGVTAPFARSSCVARLRDNLHVDAKNMQKLDHLPSALLVVGRVE
jgi:hypothetical protein